MTTGREVVRLITNMATAILVFYQNCIICIMICIRARNKWEKHIALSKMLMKCLNVKVNISLQWFYRLNNKEKERERKRNKKSTFLYILDWLWNTTHIFLDYFSLHLHYKSYTNRELHLHNTNYFVPHISLKI